MLAVGSFEPGVSTSPYQTATTEIVTRPRLTFAVRSRVYLHHKCFEIGLVLDFYHAGLDRIGERRGSGRGVGGYLQSTIFTAHKSCRVVAAGFSIARSLSGYTAHTQACMSEPTELLSTCHLQGNTHTQNTHKGRARC